MSNHMLAKVRSCAVVGMEGVIVEVEVDISQISIGIFSGDGIIAIPYQALS